MYILLNQNVPIARSKNFFQILKLMNRLIRALPGECEGLDIQKG